MKFYLGLPAFNCFGPASVVLIYGLELVVDGGLRIKELLHLYSCVVLLVASFSQPGILTGRDLQVMLRRICGRPNNVLWCNRY